ncbi:MULTISPECIES: FecR family protein [unclassified Butyricimonas]|uniref:FecR family protein n=1 Tax=unclassified Butyricimonas TaxID=2637652 RepID=UPI000C086138|nr:MULTISPECIES: FecR domain-containing protein [unclassified Butyricimonas]
MRYCDEDIEFAGQILTNREELDDAAVELWMKDKEHVRLLDELATMRERLAVEEFGHLETEELTRLKQSVADRRSRRMTLRWSVAASIILIVALYVGRGVDEWKNLNEERLMVQTERAMPGVKAELLLATGEKVRLGQRNEMIAGKKEIGIRNDSLGGLDYAMAGLYKDAEEVYNTLVTPIGGEYPLVLSDGTKVFLNAETELKYPVVFVGDKRIVDLKGEAYFEVAKDAKKPFIVRVNGAEITVLGTSFNVNTYGDDGHVYTTLVNGKVQVVSGKNGQEEVLAPGMQGIMNMETGELTVREVDVDLYVSWREGRFVFRAMTLDLIMRQLQRWYDFDVFYQNPELKDYEFWGVIRRDMDLKEVLSVMEATTNVDFKVKGKVITVIRR